MKIRPDYSSHLPALIRAVQQTKGPVIEFGGGPFSTPVLHWLCEVDGRKLVTLENDPEFVRLLNSFSTKHHTIRLVEDWEPEGMGEEWSVVFIDHSRRRRAVDAIKMKDNAEYVVVHDSDDGKYHYETVWPHFKYVYHYTKATPWTSVLSNTFRFP